MTTTTTRRTGLLASMLAPGETPGTTIISGSGAEVIVDDGQRLLDGGTASSLLVGHCHPRVVEAVQQAAGNAYVSDGNGYRQRGQAVEDLLQLAFDDDEWADAVLLTVSSSEAAELGLMLAQMLTGRSGLVCRERAYHGCVGYGRAVSVHPLWSASLVGADGSVLRPPPAAADVRTLPVPSCGVGPLGAGHDCAAGCLDDQVASGFSGAAAVIMDYTQGAVMPSAQYQDRLAALAADAGALWIADETVTAFGRLGRKFAFHRGTSRPDIVQLGKGIAGAAAPGGALVLSKSVVEMIDGRRWKTSSTFRGHPITAAAVSATQRVIAEEGLVGNAARLGAKYAVHIQSLTARHPCVETVIGEGLFWLFQLAVAADLAEGTWYGNAGPASLAEVVHRAAKARGVFIPIFSGQCVWVIPPLIIDDGQFERILEVLDESLSVADGLVR